MTRELVNEPGIDAAQLLQALGEGVFGLSREGRTTFVNAAAERALGWTAGELLGESQHDVIHHSHADGTPHALESCAIHRVLKTGEAARVDEDVFWSKDGRPVTVEYTATPVYDSGSISGVVVAFRDVTHEHELRREAELKSRDLDTAQSAREEADHARARLHRILREAPAMICLTSGPEHLIEMLNRRFEDNIGSRYVIGLPIREAFQETSVGDLFFDLMDEVYASGEPYFGYQARSMRDDDGDGFPEAEVYSDFVIQPIYDRGGVEGILLHAVDVTAQVQAQRDMQRHAAELAEGEARLRLALEAGHMGSWEWELASNTIAWSAPLEKMHGLEPGTFGGTVAEFEERIHPDDLARVRAALKRTLKRHTPLHLEHRIVRPDGVVRWIEKRGTILRDDFGRPVRLAGVSADVTERREGEEALRRSLASLQRITRALERNNKELDQFAYVASHDLKAPLRGIANLSQWIEEELGSAVNDQAKEYLSLLRGRIHRMEGLIEGILSYSRAGRAKHGADDVDVRALIEEVIELVAPPEGAVVTIEGDMPVLHTERLPLQQVLLNLITNGLKYAGGADARIRIEASEAGAFYEFRVADNGPGIAPEFHEKIWGIFQTLNPRDKVEGTGIGLALVRKIVENKGGRAWVESAAGAGATFHFLWPKNEEIEE